VIGDRQFLHLARGCKAGADNAPGAVVLRGRHGRPSVFFLRAWHLFWRAYHRRNFYATRRSPYGCPTNANHWQRMNYHADALRDLVSKP
jgi:hypothetical protein